MHENKDGARNGAQVRCYLVRPRETLLILGDLSPVVHDLDLHILSCGLTYEPLVRQLIADGLLALSLHLVSRPPDEYVGWTVSIQELEPAVNLFFTGSAGAGHAVGRAFLENIEPRDESVFFCQAKRREGEPQLSSVAVSGIDLYGMVEQFYEKSEQKLARYFHREERVALVLALPNADREWIRALGVEQVFGLPESAGVNLLSERRLIFRCGCDREKIAGVLVGAYGSHPEALFSSEEEVIVECPRCAAQYSIRRDDYERSRRQGAERK
jgi:molecular chaperone Hsp33